MSCFDNSYEDRCKASNIPDDNSRVVDRCVRCHDDVYEHEQYHTDEGEPLCEDCYIDYIDEQEAQEEPFEDNDDEEGDHE